MNLLDRDLLEANYVRCGIQYLTPGHNQSRARGSCPRRRQRRTRRRAPTAATAYPANASHGGLKNMSHHSVPMVIPVGGSREVIVLLRCQHARRQYVVSGLVASVVAAVVRAFG